jgi:hypothetical protein
MGLTRRGTLRLAQEREAAGWEAPEPEERKEMESA